MNVKNLVKLCVIGFYGMVTLVLTLVLETPPAAAHGERSQEPFLRMRTAQWYDTKWEPKKVAVNEMATLTGRIHVAEDWPRAVSKPVRTFINVGSPSSVFVRISSKVNGQPMFVSGPLEFGRDYEYVIQMRARLPGHHHIHPMLAVKEAGPVAGPGGWMDITGNYKDFTNPVKLLTGETVDTETVGLGTGLFWHFIWGVLAISWIGFFAVRPMFLIRARVLASQGDALLLDPVDRQVAAGLLVLTLVLVAVSYYTAEAQYPYTIPLQASEVKLKPLPVKPNPMVVEVLHAEYDVPGRALRMTLRVTNSGEKAVRIGEFTTAGIRFLNKVGVANNLSPEYPQELVAQNGLILDNESPINPGATRDIKVESKDAMWEVQRLMDMIDDPEQRFGGLLMFWDESGDRHINSISGPVIPVFTKLAVS